MQADAPPRPWWESRPFVAAMILLSIVPLLYPTVPPLVDLMGHMGRYRVMLAGGASPELSQFYEFHWEPIGNLGVDLLVYPLGKLIGLEPAVKLIVLSIPPLTVAGFLWVAREVHGRLPPTVLFALPFVYGHPFLFGFVNFGLAMALAFLAFGLWLRLGRLGKTRIRAVLFVPISFLIFFAHTYGWGMLGLMAFSAEAVRQHDRGIDWWKAGIRGALQAAVMAGPILFIFAWRSETTGQMTGIWFDWNLKLQWFYTALRDRWKWFDIGSLAVALIMIVEARRRPELTFSRNLAFSAMVLLAAFLLLPYIVFGSAYADMRLVPFIIAVSLLAIRFKGSTNLRSAQVLAVIGLGFYLIRIGATAVSLAMAADNQEARLSALDHVPEGARLVHLSGQSCENPWPLARNSHLGAMAIVRRHAFSNDQWAIEGANLLRVKYRAAGDFQSDPSQMVRPPACASGYVAAVDQALAAIPRDAFDYLWTIDLPPHDPQLLAGLRPIWRGQGSVLYAVDRTGGKELQ